MSDRPPKITLLVVDTGGKTNHLVYIRRAYRSKWSTASCTGQAKRCKAGECRHVEYVCSVVARCRPRPWDES